MTVASNAIFGNYSAVTRQLPRLAANVNESTLPGHFKVTGVGFAMFTTTNLTPPIGWIAVTNAPVFTNGLWDLSLTNSVNGSRFYRLQSL